MKKNYETVDEMINKLQNLKIKTNLKEISPRLYHFLRRIERPRQSGKFHFEEDIKLQA